jgi:hypothetical protein
MTPHGWQPCTAVRVTEKQFQRVLTCGHEQPIKPLEYLNDQAQRDPQQMVGHRFVCKECAK